MNAVQNIPVVTVVDGNVTTLSTDVATFFEKEHSKVIRSIENIIATLPQERLGNFSQTVVTRANPSGGAPIKSKAYRLTRDGFTFLAMGFTGARAQEFKWAYIDAFNKMEAALRQCPVAAEISVARLTVEHQYAIQSAVGKRVHTSGASYQAVYQALKNRFKVPKYTYILERDFEEAIRFIETCDLRVPQSEPITERKAQVLASAEFCEHVRTLVYCWRYLFKKEVDLVYQTMRAMGSPHAPMLWEAIHDLNLVFLEKDLEKVGFPVKALECYKHWEARNAE